MMDGPRSLEPSRIVVLGAGAWGTTLALLAAEAGHDVTLVTHSPDAATFIRRERRHPVSLPGVFIPDSITVLSVPEALADATELAIVAVPAQKLRGSLADLRDWLRELPILSAVKGIEEGTLLRPSEVIRTVLGQSTPVAALSGPNLSGEIANGQPGTTVIASDVDGLAESCARILHSRRFRVYLSDDPIGVELGGALKNIIAIGAGIGDGLGAGDNAKAAFMTRGIAEIARLGVACGAQPLTFAGLSGIGDLIATCSSPRSRNHQVGAALAQGKSLATIIASMREVAEGVATTRAALALGRSLGVELPIVEQMHLVLFDGVHARDAIERLMEREPRHESVDKG